MPFFSKYGSITLVYSAAQDVFKAFQEILCN